EWMRPELADEALRLARVLARLVPREAEVHGLVALLELQRSRFAARTDATGAPVLLTEQDRRRWDRAQIARGRAALAPAVAVRPVVGLNRGVAVSLATGPASALAIVDTLASEGALRGSHLLPGVRGELLARLGRTEEARSEFVTAASLTANERERDVLLGKAATLGS